MLRFLVKMSQSLFSVPRAAFAFSREEARTASDLHGLTKEEREAILSLGLRSQDRTGMPSMTTILTSSTKQAKTPTPQNLGADYG